jgi:hypothetical protein
LGQRPTGHLGLVVAPRLRSYYEQASLAFAQLKDVTASFQVSLFGVKAVNERHIAAIERTFFSRWCSGARAIPSLD